jgi:hypothetical protein
MPAFPGGSERLRLVESAGKRLPPWERGHPWPRMGWGGVPPSLPHAASVTDLFSTTWETVVHPPQGQGWSYPQEGGQRCPHSRAGG